MKQVAAGLLCAVLSGCATPAPPPDRTEAAATAPAPAPGSPDARLSHVCLTPGGDIVEAPAYPAGPTCVAPNRYVSIPLCGWNQRPARETPDARGRAAAADDSLVGDTFEGLQICRLPIPF